MDNSEKLATLSTQDTRRSKTKEKPTMCKKNTNNVNKTRTLYKQAEVKTNRTSFMRK